MRSRAIVLALLAGLLPACAADGPAPPANDPSERRDRVTIVRVAIEVDDVGRAVEDARALTERHEGYVQSAASGERASLLARVPVAGLRAFRRALREMGEVTGESEEVLDVTEQRADQGARLRNARREEERLLALMEERAASLSDVIAFEERLSAVRERIEQLEAAERALSSRVELAEVHVELAPRATPFWRDPIATLGRAARFGVDVLGALVVGGAAVAAGAGPTLALVAMGIAALLATARAARRLRRRA